MPYCLPSGRLWAMVLVSENREISLERWISSSKYRQLKRAAVVRLERKQLVMSKTANRLNLIDTMITEAAQKGLLHLTADSDALDGRIIHLDGRPLINFGVCSYL